MNPGSVKQIVDQHVAELERQAGARRRDRSPWRRAHAVVGASRPGTGVAETHRPDFVD